MLVYLSPHLDDVALSCGALVWTQTEAGEQVEIWTLCAGDPPAGPLTPYAQSHHRRWGLAADAVARRRAEDQASCVLLSAHFRHFALPDAIYRRHPETALPLYLSEDALFGPLHPVDQGRVEDLAAKLAAELPSEAQLIVPLAIGGHVDHRLTRRAAEALNRHLHYYADFPYAAQDSASPAPPLPPGFRPRRHPVSSQALRRWGDAVAAHVSQISTFWPGVPAMKDALAAYAAHNRGILIWESE